MHYFSNSVRKIENVLWYLFLIAIPFQTRIVFMQSDWYFNEWRAIFLYGTDILIFLLLVGWFLQKKETRHVRLVRSDSALLVFLIFAGLSVFVSNDPSMSTFRMLKLVEFVALFAYIRLYAWHIFPRMTSLIVFCTGAVWQSLIAIVQFGFQRDIGLRLFGEGFLRPTLDGVAVFINQSGERIMRAYGTFPHPNILAAYLVFALAGFYILYRSINTRTQWYAWSFAYALVLIAFLLTFSRTIIAAWAVAWGVWITLLVLRGTFEEMPWLISILKQTVLVGIVFCVVLFPNVRARLTLSSHEQAVTLRVYYDKQALRIGGHSLQPLGIGIGEFTGWLMHSEPYLPRYVYQPVHNVYLLIYAEIGPFGAIAFGLFLIFLFLRLFRSRPPQDKLPYHILLTSGLIFLFLMLFDHFPWTIQQGGMLFWLLLGIMAALGDSRNHVAEPHG